MVTGLLDYAELSDTHLLRLVQLYGQGDRKPFGDNLDLTKLRDTRKALLQRLGI